MQRRRIRKSIVAMSISSILVGSIVSSAMEPRELDIEELSIKWGYIGQSIQEETIVEVIEKESVEYHLAETEESKVERMYVAIHIDSYYVIINEAGEYLSGYDNSGNVKFTSDVSKRLVRAGFVYESYPVGQIFYIERIEDGYKIPFSAESDYIKESDVMPPLGEVEVPVETEIPEVPVETEIPEVPVETEIPEVPVETEILEVPVETEILEVPVETESQSASEIITESEESANNENLTNNRNGSSPKTGDISSSVELYGMLIGSLGVIFALGKKKMRKVNKNS